MSAIAETFAGTGVLDLDALFAVSTSASRLRSKSDLAAYHCKFDLAALIYSHQVCAFANFDCSAILESQQTGWI